MITDLFHELWATLRIRAFRLHLGMYIGGYISQDVLNAVLSYIIAFIFLGSVATASSITTWMACAQLVSVGLAIWLTLRIHAAASYRIALGFFSLGILGFATLYFAGVADIALVPGCRGHRRPRARRAELHSVERLQLHARRR